VPAARSWWLGRACHSPEQTSHRAQDDLVRSSYMPAAVLLRCTSGRAYRPRLAPVTGMPVLCPRPGAGSLIGPLAWVGGLGDIRPV
jgi:hypothetical protein